MGCPQHHGRHLLWDHLDSRLWVSAIEDLQPSPATLCTLLPLLGFQWCVVCVFVVFFFILRFDFECLLSIPTCCWLARTMTKKLRLHRPCWQQSLHANWRRVVFQRAILVTRGQRTNNNTIGTTVANQKLLAEFMHHFDNQTQETANFDRADKVQQGWSLVYVTDIWGESVDWNGFE